jgi:hypothetical protein
MIASARLEGISPKQALKACIERTTGTKQYEVRNALRRQDGREQCEEVESHHGLGSHVAAGGNKK